MILSRSSLGNTLLNYKQFIVGASASSVTEYCQVGYGNFNNRHLVVVDTPGFFDNAGSPKETCYKIGQSLQITNPGPHAFLIVLPFSGGGRIIEEAERVYQYITAIFGEGVLNYCIIVFTGLDNLNEDGITVERFLQNRMPALARLMAKCGERYVAFNNRAPTAEKNIKIQELLDLIDLVIRNNGNQVFTNNEIEAMAKLVQEELLKGKYVTSQPDGSIILSTQTERMVLDAHIREPAIRKDPQSS